MLHLRYTRVAVLPELGPDICYVHPGSWPRLIEHDGYITGILIPGSWNQDAVAWTQDHYSGSRMNESRIIDAGSKILDYESAIQNPGSWIWSPARRIHGAESMLLDPGKEDPDP